MRFFEPDSLSDTVGVYAWVLERIGPFTIGIGMMAWTGWAVALKSLSMGTWFVLFLVGTACLGLAISALRLREALVRARENLVGDADVVLSWAVAQKAVLPMGICAFTSGLGSSTLTWIHAWPAALAMLASGIVLAAAGLSFGLFSIDMKHRKGV